VIEVKHPLEIGILADTKWGYKPCKNWDRHNTIHDGSLVFSKRGSCTICLTGHDGEEHETSIDLESQLGHSPTRSISTARCMSPSDRQTTRCDRWPRMAKEFQSSESEDVRNCFDM